MDKEKKWKLVEATPAIDLKILTVEYHYYKNPRNGKTIKTIAIKGNDSVNVIALTKDKKVIMVRQFRFGIGDYTLELPGGMVDEGESVDIAAKREFREETGYIGENWKSLGKIQSNPVFMDCLVYHYQVEQAQVKYELELDEAEDVEVVEVALEDIPSLIRDGTIQHPHTISAFYFANLRGEVRSQTEK